MMLCDHAQVAGGKLYISGGGWGVTGSTTDPMAVAVLISVPWDRTNSKVQLVLALVDADGNPVVQRGPLGDVPVRVEGQFEVGRPPGVKPGTPIDVPLAMNVQPLTLSPDSRYTWTLTLNGEQHEDWTLAFSTQPQQFFMGPFAGPGTNIPPV